MKYILVFIIGLFIAQQPAAAADNQFFETLYDIPVMDGLIEVPDMALTFDKVEGRISEAGAISQGQTKAQILLFYNEALTQMGWTAQGAEVYVREGEKLEIEIEPVNAENSVKSKASHLMKFTLQPL